jgi:hypothetical protein
MLIMYFSINDLALYNCLYRPIATENLRGTEKEVASVFQNWFKTFVKLFRKENEEE